MAVGRREGWASATESPGRATLVLVNLAAIMENADEALLPAVYHEVGAALHASPSELGTLTLLRSTVQSFCYPLAVYTASRYNRAHVIALGAFLWAAATFLVAFSSTFAQVAVSRGLNGIGLALVIPAIQSLVADSTEEHNRGIAFGWLQLTGFVGSIIGGMFSISLATTSVLGIPGWRVAFHLVAIVSVVVGALVGLFAVDPHFCGDAMEGKSSKSFRSEVEELVKEAKAVIKIPSFQVIVAQGVTGNFPWSALSFAPMWLELVGFSHGITGLFMGLFSVSRCLGSLFGGFMGDYLSIRYPKAGRIVLSQISSGSAIILAAVLLLALPVDRSAGFSYAMVLFVMGLMTSWNAPATNNPIFAEIVPERSRTSIYALDRSFESVLASFAPPIVGLLAENVYGYRPLPKKASFGAKIEMDRENATSLAKALYTAISIPMSLCCAIYSFLYCTYPRDKERARMDSLISSELQQIEVETRMADHSHERSFTQIQANGSKRTEMETTSHDDGTEDGDENRLLPQDVRASDDRE